MKNERHQRNLRQGYKKKEKRKEKAVNVYLDWSLWGELPSELAEGCESEAFVARETQDAGHARSTQYLLRKNPGTGHSLTETEACVLQVMGSQRQISPGPLELTQCQHMPWFWHEASWFSVSPLDFGLVFLCHAVTPFWNVKVYLLPLYIGSA